MNTVVRQPAAVEVTTTQTKQSQAQKEQNTDDAKFMNMLSDAMNDRPAETVKSPEPAKGSNTATESKQPLTQENTETETPVTNTDDGMVYDEQATAVAVAMQMQGMLPIIAELPQTEMPDEMIAANQLIGTQPVETAAAGMAVQAEVAAADGFQADAAKNIPTHAAQEETVAAEMPKTTETAPEAETLVAEAKPETTAPRTAQTETAPDQNINRQEHQAEAVRPQTEQRQTVQQSNGTSEGPQDAAEGTDAARPSHPITMHQIRDPRESEAAQTKFDGMLERASRELNQNVTAQKVQTETEVPDEALEGEPITGQPVNTEAKPQETAKQAEAPKAETKLPEEAKPAEQTTVQKNVKAPVTEQRPQDEISKADESLLSMAQQKQPEIRQEVIRSEPVPQQQPQAERPDQAEQIKAQVLRSLDNERTEFQMQLHPEELGKVNVKMILEGGKLSVEIAAVNPKSAEMLSKQAESLAISLRASGADVSSVTVVTATESASAQMNSEYDLNNFQNRFQNRENGRNGNGRRGGTGDEDGSAGQTERENPKAPQRILNYSV